MHGEIGITLSPKAVDPGVVPDIGAVAPGIAQTEAVHMRSGQDFPHEGNRALATLRRTWRQGRTQKSGELIRGYLPRGHGEFPVFDLVQAADMAVNRHVVGWFGEDQIDRVTPEQALHSHGIAGIAADQAKRPELSEIPEPGDSRTHRVWHLISGIGRGAIGAAVTVFIEDLINLRQGKTGQFHLELQIHQRPQLDRQDLAIPAGLLGEPVIGQHIGPLLRSREMRDRQHRYIAGTEQLRRRHATMPADDLARSVDQHRFEKAKAADTVGDLADLPVGMGERVLRVGH